MEKFEKEIKKMKAITLIALVITIIVLIILAAVVINIGLGNNGILNRAKEASKEYSNAQISEKDTLDNYDFNLASTRDGTSANPTGTIISYMGNNAPAGYLKCDGTEYNIADYKTLAEQINTEFGSYNNFGGDGTTTFAVPNLQGEFLRGYSSGSSNSVTSGVTTTAVGVHQEGTQNYGVFGWSNNRVYAPYVSGNDWGAINHDKSARLSSASSRACSAVRR